MTPTALPIAIDSEAVTHFCRERGVRKLSLFGSVLREDFDPQRSDVDVLVEYLPDRKVGWKIIEHQDELSRLLGRRVDYCTRLNRHVKEAIGDEFLTLYEQA